jgi:hypothetical protein
MANSAKPDSKLLGFLAGNASPAFSSFGKSKVGDPVSHCAGPASAAGSKAATKTLKAKTKGPPAAAGGKKAAQSPLAKDAKKPPCDLVSISLSDGGMALIDAPGPPQSGFAGKFLAAVGKVNKFIQGSDLVMERILERTSPGSPAPKALTVKFSAKYLGSCPHKSHPEVTFTPGRAHDSVQPQVWKTGTPASITFHGEPEPPQPGISSWLAPFWDFRPGSAREYTFVANSCGVRDNGDPVGSRKAVLRIYPLDIYQIMLKIPPAGKVSASSSRQQSIWGNTETASSSVSISGLGYKRGHSDETSLTVTADSVKESTTHSVTSSKGTYSHTDSAKIGPGSVEVSHEHSLETSKASFRKTDTTKVEDGTLTESQEIERSSTTGVPGLYGAKRSDTVTHTTETSSDSYASGIRNQLMRSVELKPQFRFTRNGRELDLTKLFNEIVNLYHTVRSALEQIRNFKPTVGWSIDFDLRLFEGSIAGEWGMRPKRESSSCASLVEPYYVFDFNVTLFDFSLTLTVGLEAELHVFGIHLRAALLIEGSLGVSVSVEAHLEITDGRNSLPVRGIGSGSINAECSVSVGEYEVKPYQAKVTGGFEFDGELLISTTQYPRVEGVLKRSATKGKAEVLHVGWKRLESPEFVLYDEKELWKGVLPSSN